MIRCRSFHSSLLLAAVLPVAPLVAQEAPKPEPTFVLSQEDRAGGWHVLFDGTSTDAWRGYQQEGFPEQGWRIVDGTLQHDAKGGGGDLITRRQYRNFELAFEFRVAPGANSGVMYRVRETDHPSYWTGPEFQVLDDAAHGGADAMHQTGALYALYAAEGAKPKPAGEWNSARIVMFGDRVMHYLNGAKVAEADLSSDDYAGRLAKSKFADWEGFGVNRRGHLCLQDHGDEAAYRNVKARELPPETRRFGEPVVLFDGKSMDAFGGWLQDGSAMDSVWSLQDGVIVCKGNPRGYLFTKQAYEDFVLQLEWRFDPAKGAGNSGVLLRTNGEHKIWPRSIEAQLQSGNAGDFWNIDKMAMQVDAARTKGRNTKKTHGNEKPLGEWNRYEIICDDGWVQLKVNGQVLNEAWDCEDLAGWICLQSEGAEIHFRDIKLIPLVPLQKGD